METKDYAEITLDKPRHIRYRWRDVKELSRRLNGQTLKGLLDKLGEADPDTISIALLLGLRHEDSKLSLEKVDDYIDDYIRTDDGRISALLEAINEALQNCGLFRDRSKKDSAEARPQ